MEFEFSKEFLERFKLALTDRDDVYIQDSLEGVRSADICEILTEIAIEEGKYVFDMPTQLVMFGELKDFNN